MEKEKLVEILLKQQKWRNGEEGGEKANLRGADLSYADLSYADLHGANLSYADLSYADLRGANLRGANLSYADLIYADLRYADLRDADLSYAGLIVIQFPRYTAYVHREKTRIGCRHNTNEEWRSFDDETISKMDIDALAWWNAHKAVVFAAMEAVEAQPVPDK